MPRPLRRTDPNSAQESKFAPKYDGMREEVENLELIKGVHTCVLVALESVVLLN